MSYIMELRKAVGELPLMFPATSVIAIKDNMILLQKRADNGLWSYPGGYMEPGETPEDSAKREFYEETGNIALELSLYGVFAGEKRHVKYPNGDEVYVIDIVYICKEIEETDKKHDHEVLEVKWFDIDRLPENLTLTVGDIVKNFIRDYRLDKI